MHIPRLAREAGLAWGCDERAHQESSSNHQKLSSARRTASPPPGVFFRGRGSPDHLLAAGARRNPPTRGHPLICPTSPSKLERSAVSPATHTVGGPGTARPWPSQRPRNYGGDAGHPPAATPNVRDPFRSWGGSRREPTPRSPAPNIVIGSSGIQTRGWHLRLWAPLSCLLSSSSFCPSSVFRESLGRSLSSGRPFCPSHPGLPCYPGILGLRAGANSRRPSSEEGGWVALPIIPPGEAPFGPGEVQEHHLPHPGGHDAAVPRRLSSVLPIPPLAPPGLCPGDWETVTANPGGPVSHEDTRLGAFVGE